MFFVRHVRGTKTGDIESFDLDVVRIGRDPDSEIRFDPVRDGRVSGRHAQIYRQNGGWAIDDVGSKNGTFVNSKLIAARKVLSEGDVIELSSGGPKLVFSTVEPKVGETLVVSREGAAPGVGTKTISIMIGEAMRKAKMSRGLSGRTGIFAREMLHEATTYSSRRLRFAMLCAGILVAFMIAGLVYRNLENAREDWDRGRKDKERWEQTARILRQQRDARRRDHVQLRKLARALKDRHVSAKIVGPRVVANLPNVLFDFNRVELTVDGRKAVNGVASALREAKGAPRIEIEGHASREGDGSDARNVDLSRDRAESVADALIDAGIPSSSISTRGLGSSRPVASNDTEAGRLQNRRVEIIIDGAKYDVGAGRTRQHQ